jgi:Uma2 family endonuclease
MLITLIRNDYEPDICYFGPAKAQSFTPDQMKFPAPDLVVEVLSATTEAIDRGVKFEDYATHGVQEYWLVDPELEVVEQYTLNEEAYELVVKVKDGPLESGVVAGFTIPVRAIFDEAVQLAALREIVGSG